MRVRLESLGCRLNIAEMDALGRRLATAGHRLVGPGALADLIVLNSCSVTSLAGRKSRKFLRQLRRGYPDAVLVATGCHADLAPDEVAAIGVDRIIPNADKDRLAAILEAEGWIRPGDPIPEEDATPYQESQSGRTRAFVKVQDGCDNRCTFCIVTVARGAGRSVPGDEVVAEVAALSAAGRREVVLTGVHLGSYGHDQGDRHGLERLVGRLLSETSIERLRLSSLEPWDLRPELFELWSDRRLQPHLHLPLQSGCDATLARMARQTSQRDFAALVDAAHARIPDLAVSTDVIVGFPGEDDPEFEDSLAFVKSMAFSSLHVFRYSARAGTAAAAMPGAVEPAVIQDRAGRMHRLGADLELGHRQTLLGQQCEVLWEASEPYDDGLRWSGLTGSYARVVTETGADVDLHNRIEPTLLVDLVPGAVRGRCGSSCDSLPAAPARPALIH